MSWKAPKPEAWKDITLPGGDLVFRAVYQKLLEQASSINFRAARGWREYPGYIYIKMHDLPCLSSEHLLRGEIGDGIDVRCLLLYAESLTIKTGFIGSKEEVSVMVAQGKDQVELGVRCFAHLLLQGYTDLEILNPTEEMMKAALEIQQARRDTGSDSPGSA